MLTRKEKKCLEEMENEFVEGSISVKVAKQYLKLHTDLPEDPTRLQVLNFAKCKMMVDPHYNRKGLTQKGKTHISGEVNGRLNEKGFERIGQGIDTLHKKAAEQIKNYEKGKDFIDFLLSEKSEDVHVKKFSAFHNEKIALEYIEKTLLRGFLIDTKNNRLSPETRQEYLSGKFGEPFAGGHNNVCLMYTEETDSIGFDLDIPKGKNSRTLKECAANAVRLTFEKSGDFHAIPCQVSSHKTIDPAPTDNHQNQRKNLAEKIRQARNNLNPNDNLGTVLKKRKFQLEEKLGDRENSNPREILAEKTNKAKANFTSASSSDTVLKKRKRQDEGTVSDMPPRKKSTIHENNKHKKHKTDLEDKISESIPKQLKDKLSKKSSTAFMLEEMAQQKKISIKEVQPQVKAVQFSKEVTTNAESVASKIRQTKNLSNIMPKATTVDKQQKETKIIQCSPSAKTTAGSSIANKIKQARDSSNAAPKTQKTQVQQQAINVNTKPQIISKAAAAKSASVMTPTRSSGINNQPKISSAVKTNINQGPKNESTQVRERATQQTVRDRARSEQVARDRARAEQVARDRARAEQVARDRARAEQVARDRARAEQVARDRARAEQVARDRARAQQAARDIQARSIATRSIRR